MMETLLEPSEQDRLERLVGWNASRGSLDDDHEKELRGLVAKQFPREAERYKVERVVWLALGMLTAYVLLRALEEAD